MPSSNAQPLKPLSISKRVCLSTAWTVFGLVFFYLLMVALSSLSSGIVLDRHPRHGWARSASRHTGAMTLPVFSLFLATNPASLWSLFLAVMVACSHFCHFVIIASDVRIYSDALIASKIFRTELTHAVFRRLPINTVHVVGTVGLVAMLVVSCERCYGPSLGARRARFPFVTRLCCAWIWLVFNIFFIERLLYTITYGAHAEQAFYPVLFLFILAASAFKCVRREYTWHVTHDQHTQKKTQ